MKKFLLTLLTAALLLPLAACGGGHIPAETADSETAAPATETVTMAESATAEEETTDAPDEEPEEANGFRVSAYMRTDYPIDFSHLDHGVTDVILISGMYFDGRGNIILEDIALNAIAEAKRQIGDRPIRLFCMLGGEYAQAVSFKRIRDDLIPNIVDFLEEYELDGVDFDWEFPKDARQQGLYSEFLAALNVALEDKYLLSVALAPYCADLSAEAIAAIDYVELMSYDIWDEERVHAPTSVAIESVQTLLDLGFRPEQINMGIPTYGRPMMGEAYWYDYRHYYHLLDENGMYYDEYTGLIFSFNTYETVYEKTVWAIENGLGGVMTFANHCDLPADNEMALHNAIAKARADKLSDSASK